MGTLVACGHTQQADAAAAPPAAPGEVQFAPNAPQLAYLSVDTVRARRERVVAVLPAQLGI